MGTVEIVVALKNDDVAALALSSIIHALAETNSVAIARYVKKDGSPPRLVVLTPTIKTDFEALYLNILPFSEDIRQYQFVSLFTNVKKEYIPTKEQLDITEKLIRDMDIKNFEDNGENKELINLKETPNPIVQNFFKVINKKVLYPEEYDPKEIKLDQSISNYLTLNSTILSKSQDSFEKYKELFPLTQKFEEKKPTRKFWSESYLTEELKLDSYVKTNDKTQNSDKMTLESLITGGVSSVKSINPVEDFNAIFKRRDVDLINKAITEMIDQILKLINESVRDTLYPKAIECIRALRYGCIIEEEPEDFNIFLRKLKSQFKEHKKNDFWKLIVDEGISLINKDECEISDSSVTESRKFLQDNIDVVIEQEEVKKRCTKR